MSKYSIRQEKHPKTDLEARRDAWSAKQTELNTKKENLGYGAIKSEACATMEPNENDGQAKISQLLELQEGLRHQAEERNALWAEEVVVAELNKIHAAIRIEQFYILTEKKDPILGVRDYGLESRASFKSFYENKLVLCPDGAMRSKADIWLKNPLRREYSGIVFDPATSAEMLEERGLYNIWKGFARQPKQGDASKYWAHVSENICRSDEASFLYVRKWLAYVFQHPDQVHTALVLCGSQGTGKNSFVNPLGVLLGQHYAPLGNVSELVSHFNSHLKNAVLIHANEAFWGGHKKDISTLKAMITEEWCYIESKGKDQIRVRNHKHIIMSSNEDWPVALDPDDRRFYVLSVSEEHKEDDQYFKAIRYELDNGGYEALLYDLLNEGLAGFDPRKFPSSIEAFDIKIRSAGSAQIYIYEALRDGCFYIGIPYEGLHDPRAKQIKAWDSTLPKHDVFKDYSTWCRINGYKSEPSNQFGKTLKKILPSAGEARPSVGGRRVWMYTLPELEQARKEFCKLFKETERIWANEEEDES
jgi:hypothetical protein